MSFYLPKPIAMQCIWIVRDYERIKELSQEGDLRVFEQERAVDDALDRAVESFQPPIRQKLREGLFQSCQDRQDHAEIVEESGVATKTFYKIRRRFLYYLAAMLKLVPEEGEVGGED